LSELPEQIRALIPSGLDEKITHGIALWLAGHSTHEASKSSGCSQTTLWRYTRDLPDSVKVTRANYADAAEDLVYPVLEEAWKRTGEALASEKLSAMQVATIAGIATDKLVNLRRLKQQAETPASPLETLLGRLAETGGGSLTLSVNQPKTITAEARVVEDE
jgi:hypothetical protein